MGWSRTATNAALAVGLLISGLAAYPVRTWIDHGHGRRVMVCGTALATGDFWFATASVIAANSSEHALATLAAHCQTRIANLTVLSPLMLGVEQGRSGILFRDEFPNS